MSSSIPWRWIAIGVFILTSVLNYLDRFILATMVDIWRARPEFAFTYEDYGAVLAVFGIAYALSAPFMGLLLDKVGLNIGISMAVALWSFASMAHARVHSFSQLLGCRAALAVFEASAIPAAGKAYGLYLLPEERAIGSAMSQLGLSLGAALAPAFTVYFAYRYNWRWAFVISGILGLLWIPLWIFTGRRIPPAIPQPARQWTSTRIAGDKRLWALLIANALGMTFYALWTNWTPTYLVRVFHLTPPQASRYSWAVPVFGYLGAIAGGWLSGVLIRIRKLEPPEARGRLCGVTALLVVLSAGIPLLPTPLLATAGMSASYFLITAWSVNIYTIPVDIFGASGAGLAVSGLVFSYGIMQAIVSRPVGRAIEHYGFQPVLLAFAALPLLSYFLIRYAVRASITEPQPELRPSGPPPPVPAFRQS